MQTDTLSLRLAADGLRATAQQVTGWHEWLVGSRGIDVVFTDYFLSAALCQALDGWGRVSGDLAQTTCQLADLLVSASDDYEQTEVSVVALATLAGGGTAGPHRTGGVAALVPVR